MANPRQWTRGGYEDIPGSVISETSFIEGSSSTVSGNRGFIQPSMSLRDPPNYNEAARSQEVPTLDSNSNAENYATENSRDGYPRDHQNARTLDEFLIEGYEHVTYEPTLITPPPPLTPSGPRTPSQRAVDSIPNIDDATARDVAISEVAQHLCWGLTAVREMKINDIIPISAFHYILETFTESRSASWVHEPYTGQIVDSNDNGTPPKPWDVLIVPPNPYREGQVAVEVPHSARIINCHDCGTLGRRRCWSCFGNGEIRCSACNGTGQPSGGSSSSSEPQPTTPLGRVCIQCTGAGRRRCTVCLGPGQLPCKTCLARGRLKLSLRLTVTWKIHKAERVVERTSVPELFIPSVQGRIAFDEERPVLWPINFFPDEAVNHASRELLEEHRVGFPTEKIMSQKQLVRLVPVYQIAYEWRRYRGNFYIYGYNNNIYFPEYPQQVCCGLPDVWPFSLCRF